MATRTKEEERLLDEKIARIQKKNEEILKREKVKNNYDCNTSLQLMVKCV